MLAHTVHKPTKLIGQQLEHPLLAQARKPPQRPKMQNTLAHANERGSERSGAFSVSSATYLVGLSEKITPIRSGSAENEHLKRARHAPAPA